MAEALGASRYPEHDWRSRGLNVDDNSTVSEHALTAAGDASPLIVDHVPRPLVETDFDWADIVFAMTDSQVRSSKRLFGASVNRLAAHMDIEDPLGGGLEMYQKTADAIEFALMERLGSSEL